MESQTSDVGNPPTKFTEMSSHCRPGVGTGKENAVRAVSARPGALAGVAVADVLIHAG